GGVLAAAGEGDGDGEDREGRASHGSFRRPELPRGRGMGPVSNEQDSAKPAATTPRMPDAVGSRSGRGTRAGGVDGRLAPPAVRVTTAVPRSPVRPGASSA